MVFHRYRFPDGRAGFITSVLREIHPVGLNQQGPGRPSPDKYLNCASRSMSSIGTSPLTSPPPSASSPQPLCRAQECLDRIGQHLRNRARMYLSPAESPSIRLNGRGSCHFYLLSHLLTLCRGYTHRHYRRQRILGFRSHPAVRFRRSVPPLSSLLLLGLFQYRPSGVSCLVQTVPPARFKSTSSGLCLAPPLDDTLWGHSENDKL